MNNLEKIKSKWARGEWCLATVSNFTDAAVSELFGMAGYDIVWIDMEHSAMSTADALNHVRAASGAGAAPFVRVPSLDPVVVKPILELHPAGIIVPRIASPEDAERAVSSCRYPPRGVRGYGPQRGLRFGGISPPEYMQSADQQMMVILIIEDINGVNEIEAILEVPGIDSIMTGPGDLSATMGLRGQPGHPDVVAASEKVGRAAVKKGIPFGQPVGDDPKALGPWVELGVSWFLVDCDYITLFKNAARVAKELRDYSR